jgi:hypothetical protein
VDGERTEVELARGETLTIQLSPEQLDSLRLEPIEGAAGVASFFTAPIDRESIAVDPDVRVTRSYGGGTTFEEGDLVKVTLAVQFGAQALDGCYQLSDLLPSGLRAVVNPWSWGLPANVNYPYRIEGQRVSFCVTKQYPGAIYFARVVSAGQYTAEPAVAQSITSAESINFSPPNDVAIR